MVNHMLKEHTVEELIAKKEINSLEFKFLFKHLNDLIIVSSYYDNLKKKKILFFIHSALVKNVVVCLLIEQHIASTDSCFTRAVHHPRL